MRRPSTQPSGADPTAGRDAVEIQRFLSFYAFPWDFEQSLSLALFRTFAVPSIGELLNTTGEFTRRPQKRYDDTAIVLEEILRCGAGAGDGREALRRMNRMHGSYPISNDDLRYVLSTFVVMPRRWLEAYGWRRLAPDEVSAMVQYNLELGRLMGIRDLPQTFAGFSELMDGYEREHFAFSPGGRRVADATLELMASWYPRALRRLVRAASIALLDEHLVAALHYPPPSARLRRTVRVALRLRALVVRLLPPRRRPRYVSQTRNVRSYPGGYDVRALGTFPSGGPAEPAGSGSTG